MVKTHLVTTCAFLALMRASAAFAQTDPIGSTVDPTNVGASGVQPPPPVTPSGASIGAPRDREPRNDDPKAMQPVGAHFGSFTLFPKLESAVTYDDNVYALENKTNDIVFRLTPSARLAGDFGRDKLTITGSLDQLEYSKQSGENRTDWRTNLVNKYELAEKTLFSVNGGYSSLHEDRGDPNSGTTNLKPAKYDRTEAGVSLTRDLAALRGGVRLRYAKLNYSDARQIGGGLTTNNDRDRQSYSAEGRVSYVFSTGYSAIVRVTYDDNNYRLPVDDGGFDRDSKGLKILGGIEFELSRLLTGEITGGYLRRKYDDPRFPLVHKLNFNANLDWYLTELTSLEFIVNRSAEETVATGYSSFVATTYSVRAEHELLRTVKLTGTVRYIVNDYERATTAAPFRKEKFYGASAGVRYDLNRNFYLLAGYDWNKKTSTATTPGSAFSRNKASLTVGAQF